MRIAAVNAESPFLGCVLFALILLVGAGTVIAADAPTATLTGRVTVSDDGCTPYTVSGIVLEVGREVAADMALQPGFEEEISVEASYQAIDPTQTQVVTNITTRQITALPLPTRNYLELAYLAPGVNPSRDVGFDGVVSAGGQEARNGLT